MKNKILVLILIIVLSFAFIYNLSQFQNPVIESLGKYETKQIYYDDGFMDYTDFGKYTYSSVNLEKNRYFQKINDNETVTINAHIRTIEDAVESIKLSDKTDELVLNYTFNRSCIDNEDYFYIKYGVSFDCFDMYIFDTQSNTLYYFHNNS